MPWIGTLIQFLGGFSTLGLAWVLFPVVATFMVGLFVEDISEAIELAFYGINGYLLGREYFEFAPIDTWT
jgi:uncharacterized protein involved in cysteine biosynthesis